MLKENFLLFLSFINARVFSPGHPFICTYITTWRCNAKCRMCGVWEKEKTDEMNILEIAETFKKIRNIGIVRITGGEPFLREDLAEVVDAIARNTSMRILHITTNGILQERIVKFIKNVNFKNIHLKITLNGYKGNHDKIMGVPGAYDKIISTIEELKRIQKDHKFVLAINQTIVDKESYKDSEKISALCSKLGVSYLPIIAAKGLALLEPDGNTREFQADFKSFGEFSEADFKVILKDLMSKADNIGNPIEKAVKKYYLKGLYNRLIFNKKIPNPGCVALKNHIRILPGGKVPVCLFNSTIAGDLLKDDFSDLWNSVNVIKLRKWVGECSGCWDECETIPNAIYSASTIKYLIPLFVESNGLR